MPCICGTDLVVVARLRAAAVPRESWGLSAPGSSVSVMTGQTPRCWSGAVGRDEQVVEAAFAIGGQERVFDTGRDRGLPAQLPVRNGRRGQVHDVDRHEVVRGQRGEVLPARV